MVALCHAFSKLSQIALACYLIASGFSLALPDGYLLIRIIQCEPPP